MYSAKGQEGCQGNHPHFKHEPVHQKEYPITLKGQLADLLKQPVHVLEQLTTLLTYRATLLEQLIDMKHELIHVSCQ